MVVILHAMVILNVLGAFSIYLLDIYALDYGPYHLGSSDPELKE